MGQSSNPLPKVVLRRHARATALCLTVVVSVTIALYNGHFLSSMLEDAHRDYHDLQRPAGLDLPDSLDPASHSYKKDGLLIVNPNAPHPIYELVGEAEARWRGKLRRASKTLEQAVMEYKIRYKRSPPKGFDHWWNYVQKHNVQLPDEYDQIYHDLEPYWGIDPRDLQAAQATREGKAESLTISKDSEHSKIIVANMTFSAHRQSMIQDFLRGVAQPQIDLLEEVYQRIPAFRATINPEDTPFSQADWVWKRAALEAARKGTYLKPKDLPPLERGGWSGTCPRDSPLFTNPPKWFQEPTPQRSKTFIYNHRASMDPCYNPELILSHGIFLAHGTGPPSERFTGPLFSISATSLHMDILITSMAQSSKFADDDPEWDHKQDDRLFWRGTPTGMWHQERFNWRSSQRVRLVNLTGSRAAHRFTNAEPISFLNPDTPSDEPVGNPVKHSLRRANSALMDINFSGTSIQCEPGVVCDTMREELSWAESVPMGPNGAGRYKYILDVDGNGWSQRFRRLMSSHSLVFKSTVFPEWWTDRAQAWVHYVPVQVDYSDLYDSLAFFTGDLRGEGAHENMAKKIGKAGREWVEKFWREEDITAYMFRLWLEYARVMSVDRDSMNFRLPEELED